MEEDAKEEFGTTVPLPPVVPVDPTRKKPWYTVVTVAFLHQRVFVMKHSMFVPLARRETQYACTQFSTLFSKPLSVARRKSDAYRSAFLDRVLLPFTSLGSFTYTAVESTKNQNPSQYLLCR